ncbi:hypothetical protein DQG13_28340 [Paenibacillus sp. YN15]|nr:hypothetical protein DQG13_28340 [Paenibacillus sp. YN15]
MKAMNVVGALVKQEMRKILLPALFTGIFFAFMGGVTGMMFLELDDPDRSQWAARMIYESMADLVAVSMTCCLGFTFTRDYFSFYRTDAFSRKLAFYRKLPVTDREIVAARYLVFLISLLPMALCYFAALYLPVRMEQLATGTEFIQAAVLWLGMSLAGGAGFLYLELGVSGKAYLLLNAVVMGVMLAAVIALNLGGLHLVGGSLSLVRRCGIWPSLAGVAAGAAIALLVARATVRRLAVRDLF